MQRVIDQCRKRFGPSPRSFPLWSRLRYLRTPPPAWLRKRRSDGLWELYRQRSLLLTRGTIVWAHLVQANEVLFSPGKIDAPAMVIYSPDPYFDAHLDELAEMASRLFALKDTKPEDAELARFARFITDEMDRNLHVPIPSQISENRTVIATGIMVHRKHLPFGVLTESFFPLLALPEVTPATMILPERYWPDSLLRAWGKGKAR